MSHTLKHDDSGATALVIAGAMVLIMGILAVAVDIGFGQAERRIDQTGADAAALAGSLELVISDEPDGLVAALDRVYEIVDTNLGRTLDYALWAGCNDANALFYTTLSDLGASNGSNCVSLSEDFNTFRVRVPDQALDTYFAGVIGSDSISVHAAAEAERNAQFGGGGNVPFFVLDGTAVGTELCIKTGSNGSSACGSSSSGNFGDFEPYFYGAVGGDLSTICDKGNTPNPLARAVAMGLDHEFSRFTPYPGGTERVNGSWCGGGVPGPLLPNTIQPGGGYVPNEITDGLVKGATWPSGQPFPGRLRRSDTQVTAQHLGGASIFGFQIDNRPIWDYIDQTQVTGLVPCEAFAAAPWQGHATDLANYQLKRDKLVECMNEALAVMPTPTRIFSDEILETPRMGAAPRIWENFPPPNNSFQMHIQGLNPVFIESVYAEIANPHFNCSASLDNGSGLCIHRAGIDGTMTVTSPGQRIFQSAGAMILDCALLPVGTCPSLQDPSGGGLTFLYDLQLTR